MKRDSAEPKPRHLDNESAMPLVAANEEPRGEKWSRPARFLFGVIAAIACWAVPVGVLVLIAR